MTLPVFSTKDHEKGPFSLGWADGRSCNFDLLLSEPGGLRYAGSVKFKDGFYLKIQVSSVKRTPGKFCAVATEKSTLGFYLDKGGPAFASELEQTLSDIGDAFQLYFAALPPGIPGAHDPQTAPRGTQLPLEVPGQPPLMVTLDRRNRDDVFYVLGGKLSSGLILRLQLIYTPKTSKIWVYETLQLHKNTIAKTGMNWEFNRLLNDIETAFVRCLAPAPAAAAPKGTSVDPHFANWI